MSDRRPPSALLCAYYGFLLLTTAMASGYPYPLFGVLLEGRPAAAALVLDCLVLVHIVVGAWKAQRLSWWLMMGYNAFNLASLAASLAFLGPADLAALVGDPASLPAFYAGASLSAAAMVAVTAHAWRLRDRFVDRNPFLF